MSSFFPTTFWTKLKESYRLKSAPAKSRPLTDGEIALAREVFGNQIELDEVRLKTAWWVLKHYAVSPNGNIYFHPADWREDFSQAALGHQGWLIHELTHVWQLQQGLKVIRGALVNRRYEYAFESGKTFFAYGIEQQAQLVQDYYIRRELEADCQAWEQCLLPYFGQLGLSEKSATSAS